MKFDVIETNADNSISPINANLRNDAKFRMVELTLVL
jgi:hypothetical protein